MKHIFTLLVWACAVALVGCKDDDTAEPNLRFLTPEATDVSVTTATVSFPSAIDNAILSSLPRGIAYGEQDALEADYAVIENPEVDGRTMRCRLTDLKSGTDYRAYAYVQWGATRIRSEAVAFRTEQIGLLPVLEITSSQPMILPADADDYAITYIVHNPVDGEWPEASSGAGWVNSLDNTEPGEIAFHVDANTDTQERSTTLTLSYTGASPVAVNIRQKGREAEPEKPQTVQTLTASDNWPNKYPSAETVCTLGGHEYRVRDAADFGSGIQFKKTSGYLANGEDMGVVRRVEVVYRGSGNTDMTLALGDTPVPAQTELQAVKTGDTYVFDCTAYTFSYFTLRSGDGASFIESIRITCGGDGGTPTPDPVEEPQFGSLSFSNLTKNSVTIACTYSYAGEKSVTAAWFLYNASGAAEQRAALQNVQPGTKTVSLTGLTPATRYSYRLCVEIDGKTYTSGTASFMTLDESGKPVAGTRYTGWAELPTEDAAKLNNEYFYAYHLCPDYPSSGRKARNFTTCYSKSYKCPVWVAAPLHDCYTGSVKRTNAYRTDPDIKCPQVEKRDGYTRGHMLGSGERTITTAVNRDVFYISNIGPQLGQGGYFNTGGGQWNTAEDWVDKQWRGRADTCYQVVGSYWKNTSTVSSGTTVPTHYYIILLKAKKSAGRKWVVDCTREELQTIAILIEHKSYTKSSVTKADQFQSKGFFKSVAEIEQLTGQTFFANVPNVPKDTYNPGDWNF